MMSRICHLLGLCLFVHAAVGQENKCQYDLNIAVFPAQNYMAVKGTVLVPLQALKDSITFVIDKSFRNVELKPVNIAYDAITVDSVSTPQKVYAIKLKEKRSGNVTIAFSYDGGEKEGFQFYLGEDGSFASSYGTAWYPENRVGNAKAGYNLLRATGKFRFVVPRGYTAVMSGAEKSVEENGSTSFLVTYPTKISFCVGRYSVAKYAGVVPVEYYSLQQRSNTEEYLKGCSAVLKMLVATFGKYPFRNFTLVEIPEAPAERQRIGGASYMGGIWMPSTALEGPFNTALYGHEIGHQWWGNMLFNNGEDGTGMLDEAMAQYGAHVAVETLEGEKAAELFRRTGFPGYISSQSGLGYLKLAAAGKDAPLAKLLPNMSHTVGDSKGFMVYHLLALTMGKEVFHAALKNISRKYGFKGLTWQEFLAELQKFSKVDLQPFFRQWFYRTGAPEWTHNVTFMGRTVKGNLIQQDSLYNLQIETVLKGKGDSMVYKKLTVSAKETAFSFKAPFTIREIIFDPHFKIIHWEPQYRKIAQDLLAYSNMLDKRIAAQYKEADSIYAAEINRVPLPDIHAAAFSLHYEKARVEMLQGRFGEAIRYFQLALAAPSRKSELLPYLFLHMATCAKEIQNEELFKKAANDLQSADALLEKPSGALQNFEAKWGKISK